MALKLGKCRLCLKLGDFYSIFTVDNTLQLAEMVMACARIKVYEGDGLPDKVCSECIEKLSSAYIFKQQCERSDQELRRNYIPPPGFSITPPPNRQSSDSGFSNRTDASNKIKQFPAIPEKAVARAYKRGHDSDDDASVVSRDYHSKASGSKINDKRPRIETDNVSDKESDYEDNVASQFSAEDSDEPLLHKCEVCDREFLTKRSLSNHTRTHTRNKTVIAPSEDAAMNFPSGYDQPEDEEKVSCEKCGKQFKLKIMLKRHYDVCPGKAVEKKELKVTLENLLNENKIDCEMCKGKFKTIDNLEKHMRVVHAAVLKKNTSQQSTFDAASTSDLQAEPNAKSTSVAKRTSVPCVFCHRPFDNYYIHNAHFNTCTKRSNAQTYVCLVCRRKFQKKSLYFAHLKETHLKDAPYEGQPACKKTEDNGGSDQLECRLCKKKLATQELLITHLAAHMANVEGEEPEDPDRDNSRSSILDDSHSQNSDKSTGRNLKCTYCDKVFTYKKSLMTHVMKHTTGEIGVKAEPPPEPPEPESDSDDDGDNTCDICDKMFSYKRLLVQHKRTKHNMSSGVKRANVSLKSCDVMCQICDVTMKVGDSLAHNRMHSDANIRPRNVYTCVGCGDTFTSSSGLADHIKLVHRLKRGSAQQKYTVTNMADFCEVVVTKSEPLDSVQSHNDFLAVPGTPVDCKRATVDLDGFTCPICGKKMATLMSLKRHVNWHSNVGNNIETKHECFVCKATFKFIRHFKMHMREHYHDPNLDPKFLICSICNRKSKHLRAAQMHMKFHNQTRFRTEDYQCSICKRVFQYRKVYLSHMAIHYKRGESIALTADDSGPALTGAPNECPHCGKVCDSENSLKCHISWHKSKSSLFGSRYDCTFCDKVFTNKKLQELHTRTHYEDDNGPFKCHICSKGFIDEDYYRRHVKGHNFDHQSHKKRLEKLRANKVKCPICTRYYPDLVKLIRHLRRTHPETKMIKEDPDAPPPQVFPCKLCAKVFHTERRLRAHEGSHLRRHQFFKCKFCGKKAISLKNHRIHIKGHLTQKHVDEPLKCYECNETFVRGYALHHHLRDAHGITETWICESGQPGVDELRELQCSVCYKVLASKGNFERHIDYHNLLRCNYCFDYFNSLKFLEGHLAFSCDKKKLIGDTEVHPKKVKCHVCYKAFHLQVKLDCHMRTRHDILVNRERRRKEKEIVCDYCFRSFENEDALNQHKLYHRTIGYYGCIYCSRKFKTLTAYRAHKNHHFAQLHVDDPVKCEHCDETFTAFREMIYHMRDDHGDDKEWVVMPKEVIEEKCNICDKTFFNVQRHLQLHEENRCRKCGEYFMSRVDYDQHLCAIESDEDPDTNDRDIRPKYEECEFCFKPITKANSKLKHDLIHKGSGAISCRFCALKFKTMDAFNIHAFSHRSRKYKRNPLKCRACPERFVKYGPFIKHMKSAHKISEKMHYRTTVLPERCVVCFGLFPNLHNHYRAHLLHRCSLCKKYFTSNRAFLAHACDRHDDAPGKVFTCDEDLDHLINTYIPKDEVDHQKYYGNTDDEDEPYESPPKVAPVAAPKIDPVTDDDSQTSQFSAEEEMKLMPISIQSPIISDVLSLYESKREAKQRVAEAAVNGTTDDDVVEIVDDNSNSVDVDDVVITIDD